MPRYYTLKKNVPLKHGQTIAFTKGRGYWAKGVPTAAKRSTTGQVLLRDKLVTVELALAKLGIREQGGNNHGPWMDKFAAEVGLPAGYPWCAEFQSYSIHKAAGRKLPIESASVAAIYNYGKQHGWTVARPFRGDLACFDFDGDGQYDDHIELVVKVLGLGPVLTLQTVGGNTSSGISGSQADGDGVWLRRRVIARKAVAFVRIPGSVPA